MPRWMCSCAATQTPLKTIDIIQAAFDPQELRVKELYRGKGALAWSDGLKKPSI